MRPTAYCITVNHRIISSRSKKTDSEIQLVFFDGISNEIQSRMDPTKPLHLISPYSQAMMLSLAWQREPQRVCIIGLGGGRIPLVLHTCYPQTQIDCIETDPDVVEVAQEYFGVVFDETLRAFVADGRTFLQKNASASPYDIIMIDISDGDGCSPSSLSTREFFEECRHYLEEDGIVAINLLTSDASFLPKIHTMATCFSRTTCLPVQNWRNTVFFASHNNGILHDEVLEEAQHLQGTHCFSFPFVEHAAQLQELSTFIQAISASSPAEILTDSGFFPHSLMSREYLAY